MSMPARRAPACCSSTTCIATGGTALAAARLVRRAGGIVSQARFVIDLPDLGGAEALRAEGIAVASLMEFAGT